MSGSMTFCQEHWNLLRQKIDDAGLGDLVSEGGEEAATRQKQRFEGAPPTLENFDPLMEAHNAVMFNTLNMIGPWEGCPICTLDRIHEETCEGCDMPDEGYVLYLDYAVRDVTDIVAELKARKN